MQVLLRKKVGMRAIWKRAPGLRAAKDILMRIHSSEVWRGGGKVGMGWEERDRMSVGEPRWENVQARDVVGMVFYE
jgi:hypothetical protein